MGTLHGMPRRSVKRAPSDTTLDESASSSAPPAILWIDVTDLLIWPHATLSGIQRVNAGLLRGLLESGTPCRLFALRGGRRGFEVVHPSDLPDVIRAHVVPSERVQGPSTRRRRTQPMHATKCLTAVFGDGPLARPVVDDVKELYRAGKALRRDLVAWARRGNGDPDARATHHEEGRLPALARNRLLQRAVQSGMQQGDTVLSAASGWGIQQHAASLSALRALGVRVASLIYDVIPVVGPQWVPTETTKVFEAWLPRVLSASDQILTISRSAQRDILGFAEECGIPRPEVHVLRLSDTLTGAAATAARRPAFVPERPFFVFVSTIEPRKNHQLTRDAWSLLHDRRRDVPDLLWIGRRSYGVHDIVREVTTDPVTRARVHLLEGVGDDERAWYYAHCVATVYPSHYEGWGLPVAESLVRGVPVFASNAASLPEIAPELTAFFDPRDAVELANLVERALDEPAWLESRRAAIQRGYVATTLQDMAQEVLGVLRAST